MSHEETDKAVSQLVHQLAEAKTQGDLLYGASMLLSGGYTLMKQAGMSEEQIARVVRAAACVMMTLLAGQIANAGRRSAEA